jgi:ribosomal protein S18 acetylase RimI-like enzyme
MTAGLTIATLRNEPQTVAALADIIVEAVAHGASLSFMDPLSRDVAFAFWERSLAAADAGGRLVLGAIENGELAGTVTLDLDTPPNQPHRANIAKMMTRVRSRGRRIATALMHEAERLAIERGRSLLTLDSATKDGAGPFYEKMGFTRVGVIPDYALTPAGELCGTIVYYKRIGSAVT